MNTNHSFIKGTIILISANAISKLLGAFFKIPLAYILNEDGMAIFNTAMSIYSTVLSFVISGFPLAVSRLISNEFALENHNTVRKIARISAVILSILGAVGALILYFGSDFFAYAMKDPMATLAIKVISPSVFFVALGTVFKSYFHGTVNMLPTAISQVTEAFVRLFAGFFIARTLIDAAVEITAAGAISGITVGEIIATLILFLLFLPASKGLLHTEPPLRTRAILGSLFQIALPMFICSFISCLMNLADTASIRNSLLNIRFTPNNLNGFLLKYSSHTSVFDSIPETLKMSIDGARWLFGAYSGYALTVFHLPTGIIGALGASVFPIISGELAKGNTSDASNTLLNALKTTVIIILPCSLILLLFSEEILNILFKNTASAHLLALMSPSLMFLSISELFTLTLHAMGRVYEPFLYSVVGMAIKLSANFLLVPIPSLNIGGAIIGSGCAFFVMMLLNIKAVKKYTDIKLSPADTFIKPVFAALVMLVVIYLVKNPFHIIFGNDIFTLAMSCLVGITGYLLALLITGTINRISFM